MNRGTVPKSRSLGLSGATNFRDFGGYPTMDGASVRWRRLFRSNHLGRLTAGDHAILSGIAPRRICDLRGASEGKEYRAGIAGATVHSLPIEPRITRAIRARTADGQAIDALAATLLMEDTYRDFVRAHTATYRELFGLLLIGDDPVVIHCSAGKDRTGFAAAAILAALDVPRDIIVHDYLLTNELWRNESTSVDGLPPAVMAVLLRAEERFLAAAFDAVTSDFGDFATYLDKGLGINAEGRRRLKALYVGR